jgi:hypothetical protein
MIKEVNRVAPKADRLSFFMWGGVFKIIGRHSKYCPDSLLRVATVLLLLSAMPLIVAAINLCHEQ